MVQLMLALTKGSGYGLKLQEIPVPVAGPGEVLVQVKAVGICGADLRKYRWVSQAEDDKPPVSRLGAVFGHEYSGVIAAVGEGVSAAQIGERVSGETHIPCGRCYQCRHGQRHICSNLRILGSNIDGCFAEFVVVPEITARRIPDVLSFESGAVLEPFGVGVHASERAQVDGETTLVLGAGPIGLFTALAVQAQGAAVLWQSELSESRRELASKMGTTHVLDPATDDVVATVLADTDGVGCGVSIETTGSLTAFQQGLQALRKGGRMVVAGTPSQPVQIQNPTRDLLKKESTIMGIHGREMWGTWEVMDHLITDLGVDPGVVITHRFALDAFAPAFGPALRAEGGKILLVP